MSPTQLTSFALTQVKALRTAESRTRSWVLITALGFASVFVFEALRPGIVTGGHPAPLELCAGAALSALAPTLLGFLGPFLRSVLSEGALFAVGQIVFYLVYGPILGATAGFLSGRAMMESLPPASGSVGAVKGP